MKFLHTSDWHLGRTLYGRKRYDEFCAFLDWLVLTIEQEKINVLLVAGDVFDTSTPGNRAQNLYYRFLFRVSTSCCRHIVIIGGNHDSPSFLNAPKELLQALNVYVIGAMTERLEDEVIVIDKDEQPRAIVCAVPYLRDKDIRTTEPGETIDAKNTKLVDGLKKHYAHVCDMAEQKRKEFVKAGHPNIPVIVMGHLFTAGAKTVDQDGVRDLYVGSLVHVGKEVFSSSIDYAALGHLHVPQTVGGCEQIRYSGSPIPMGFGEAGREKRVVIIEFSGTQADIREVCIPCFQPLLRIAGSLEDICEKLGELKNEKSCAWLEIEYTGQKIVPDLRKIFDEAIIGSDMEIIRIKNRQVMDKVLNAVTENETLDDLDTGDVFTRCLDAFDVPDEQRKALTESYEEIIKSIHEQDVNRE